MTVHWSLVAAKVLVLVLGSAIAALALLAYRRMGDSLLLYLGVGIGLVAVGAFVEGLLYEVLAWDLLAVHIVESVFVLTGFAILAILLRPRESRRPS